MSMEFVFVNVQKPSDALQLAKESQIRSHVTRLQWKNTARQNKRSQRKILFRAAKKFTNKGHDTLQPALIQPQIGGLRVDPFRSYPVSVQPWTSLLVDHYLVHMAVDIPELDLPGNHGLLRTSWFPLVMTDPALFSVIILLAASHYACLRGDLGDTKSDLLSLRCEAVSFINKGLETQQPEALHDALIGAIAKMASYEAMFGSMENYNIHMQGLVRAIRLRGGLTSLGLNGLLNRIVLWIDRNAAFLHGSTWYFSVDEATMLGGFTPAPNPGQFLGGS